MYVLIAYVKGSTREPITVGAPTMLRIIEEIAHIEYLNRTASSKITYVVYNGCDLIIDANGDATEQGDYIRFKGEELAKERKREELVASLKNSNGGNTNEKS